MKKNMKNWSKLQTILDLKSIKWDVWLVRCCAHRRCTRLFDTQHTVFARRPWFFLLSSWTVCFLLLLIFCWFNTVPIAHITGREFKTKIEKVTWWHQASVCSSECSLFYFLSLFVAWADFVLFVMAMNVTGTIERHFLCFFQSLFIHRNSKFEYQNHFENIT